VQSTAGSPLRLRPLPPGIKPGATADQKTT